MLKYKAELWNSLPCPRVYMMLMLLQLLAVGNDMRCDMVEILNIDVETYDRVPL